MKKNWYVVRTKPNKEETAKLNYKQQDLEVYLPTIVKKIKHARQIKEIPRPLFPGYLFLHLDQEEILSSAINYTKGAIGLVKFEGGVPVVPETIIAELRHKEDEKGNISLKFLVERFTPGQEVKVTNGSTELSGFFQEIKGRDRALILLDFLNRQTKTIVPIDTLTAA